MKKYTYLIAGLKDRRGATAIVVALVLVVLVGIAALAVDIGYVAVTKNELQNAADAAALAGARQMGENYHNGADPVTDVTSVAQNTASKNKAAGLNLAEDISAGNVVTSIGTWDPTKPPDERFAATSVYPNAVQVVAKREGETTNGPIGTFFAPIFKLLNPASPDTVNVGATACAALTGPCEAEPEIPLGIGRGWFDTHPGDGDEACGPTIKLNNTSDSCAGWTNLLEGDKEANWMKDILPYMDGTKTIPTITVGKTYEFTGGTITGLLEGLLVLFNNMKGDEDGDPATPDTWTTYVVVYDLPCGVNPTNGVKIVGFATLTITEVIPTGADKGVWARVACHMTTEDPGGCKAFGTFSKYPNLVQ